MRTETIKRKYYKFEELSEDRQKEVLDEYRHINIEYEDFEYIKEMFLKDLKKIGFEIEHNDIVYSMNVFYGRYNHFGVMSKNILNQLVFDEIYHIETPEKLGVFLSHMGGGICNKNHTEKGLAICYFEDGVSEDKQKEISFLVNEKIDNVIDICDKFYNIFYEEMKELVSDERVKETIIINRMEFEE